MSQSSFQIHIGQYDDQISLNQILQQKQNNNSLYDDSYGNNRYQPIYTNCKDQNNKLCNLQVLLKTQKLLLQHEQKHKKQKIKQIQFTYIKTFNNYLLTLFDEQKPIIINNKDIMLLGDISLLNQLNILKNNIIQIKNITNLFHRQDFISQAFLNDFHNFYPNWYQNITNIIKMEIDQCQRIQDIFEMEKFFPKRIITQIYRNNRIHRFCQNIFLPTINLLHNINEQLIIDYIALYQNWNDKIKQKDINNALYEYIYEKNIPKISSKQQHNLHKELSKLIGYPISQIQQLLYHINESAKNQQLSLTMMKQLGLQQIDIKSINKILWFLVQIKINDNRIKLTNIIQNLMDVIIQNYLNFPAQIKYIMSQICRLVHLKINKNINSDDFKNIFNKLIFSQLLLKQFIDGYKKNQNFQKQYQKFNITIITLISQKIIFGQQFYEKYKQGYGTFNPLIVQYSQKIKIFIEKFNKQQTIIIPKQKQIQCWLLSFSTIQLLYKQLRNKKYIENLPTIDKIILNKNQLEIDKYLKKMNKIYYMMTIIPNIEYLSIFKIQQKYIYILINFLIDIDIIDKNNVSLKSLIQQYKTIDHQNDKKNSSIQIYAHYLNQNQAKQSLNDIFILMQSSIQNMKKQCLKIKIILEQQYNYVLNLQNMYMNILTTKKYKQNKNEMQSQLQLLLKQSLGFDYEIIDNKLCQCEYNKNNLTIEQCINDISQYFKKGVQGCDALYHMLIENILQKIENKGITNENKINYARQFMGQQLYKKINLNIYQNKKDILLLNKIKHLQFINCNLLELSKYQQQQQLIISLCKPLIKQLKLCTSSDVLLNIFNQITLVFQNVILITGKPSDITADLQIPFMILVLIKCQINNLFSLIQFIQLFCHEETNSTHLGQTLTLVKSVVFLIESMNAKKLNITEQQYQRYMSIVEK